MATKITLDHKGMGEILRSPAMHDTVEAVAAEVAGPLVARGLRVIIDHYTTDRAAAAVVVEEPNAAGMQAKDGILTRAAAAVGLEVHSR